MNIVRRLGVAALVASCLTVIAGPGSTQPPSGPGGPPPGGPGGIPFGPGGPGGFGPPGFGPSERKVLKDYDLDKNGWLNAQERNKARESMAKQPAGGSRGPRRFPGMGRGEPAKPGPKVTRDQVANFPATTSLYDGSALRTLFIDFENADWEKELDLFHGTDVDVPCTLEVDGKKYPLVGVRFRGMSSFGMVQAGSKRSFNLTMDLANEKQRLLGSKTLNLLNAHDDSSFLSSILYSHIARKHIAAPKANLVKVVVNGESWGIYNNVQQFNKEFMAENFGSPRGLRWKVSGSPGGRGGLEYTGDDIADYKRRFEIKSADKDESWKALINLCKVLNQTPPDQLKAELEKILDVEGLLWFLALDIGLINGDGYWIRSSDYSICQDEKGKFHILPHDMNEAFHAPHGPGMGGPGGPGGRGGPGGFPAPPKPGDILPFFMQNMLELTDEQRKKLDALQKETDTRLQGLFTPEQRKQLQEIAKNGPMGFPFPGGPGGPAGPGGNMGTGLKIDPLGGLNDVSKPLRSKVLAVPELRQSYMAKIKQLAEKDLDWVQVGPLVKSYRALLDAEIKADTRKLSSYEDFLRMTADVSAAPEGHGETLRQFFDGRRKFLLEYPEVKKAKP
ncbi:MAG: spore coat protein CotH [Planctomycetota bacterium]|nr:MAG: spore coat protein CotH [Planctomycetota bacterium]